LYKIRIDEEMLLVEGEALLPGLEEEALAQFQQGMFELVDDGGFEVGFRIFRLLAEAEKLQHIGLFEQVCGPGHELPFRASLRTPSLSRLKASRP